MESKTRPRARSLAINAVTLGAVLSIAGALGAKGAGPDLEYGVAPPGDDNTAQELPSLIVFVVVDQLGAELLERYSDLYQAGFRRLMDEGFSFTQASHQHAITETAAGHATLSTGVFPSRSGVVANNWDEQWEGGFRSVYAVSDTLSPILGVQGMGGRSPANLRVGGLANWVSNADSDARIVSISTKDRAAIPMAGRVKGEVYWIAGPESLVAGRPIFGRFVTSTYYRTDYPDWVESYNEEVMAPLFADSVWVSPLTPELERRSRPDEASYEADGVHSVFPHSASEELDNPSPAQYGAWLRETPSYDRGTLGLTLRAIDELDLGQRGSVDYLSVSFSQVDYVGAERVEVKHFNKPARAWRDLVQIDEWDGNEMYLAEVAHFFGCIADGATPMLDAAGGRHVLKMALASRSMARQAWHAIH